MIAHFLLSASKAVLPALGDHLWQSTLFAVAAGLLTLPLRRNQARVRYWLWLAASAKFLIPFSLLVSLGGSLAWSRPAMGSEAGMYAAIDQVSQPFSSIRGLALAISATPSAAGHSFTALWPLLLALAWLYGSLAVLAVWLVQYRRILKLVRKAKPLREGREVETLRRLEERAGMSGRIEMLSSSASLEPGVFGVFRPVLLWPEGISRRLDDAHLEAVLAHELCHVQRRDNLTSVLHMLVEALFWFHPLVWWMAGRLVAERERACDEAVLRLGKQPQTYAEGILKVCEFCVSSPLSCVSGITGADLKERIARIMAKRPGDRLTRGRKVLLAATGAAAIAAPIVFGQTKAAPAAAPSLKFDVVSVKPYKSGCPMGSGILHSGDGFHNTCATLHLFLRYAYAINSDDRLVGEPKWAKTDFYGIEAKVAPGDAAAFQKLKPDQVAAMLQSALEDRFHLKVHHETRVLPVYALIIAKGGSKLREAQPGDPSEPETFRTAGGKPVPMIWMRQRGKIQAWDCPLSYLLPFLSYPLGRTVVDQTGLTGNYTFTLQWTPESMSNRAPSSDDSGPSIFTALQEQLGLKLESTKGPTEVLVIDHIERPSPN